MSETREIVICTNCEGKGVKVHAELTCYHKGEYDYTSYPCKACEGSGRRVKTVTTVYRPYTTSNA
jgi:DnaJ-class molecular chaperone